MLFALEIASEDPRQREPPFGWFSSFKSGSSLEKNPKDDYKDITLRS